MEGVTIYFFDKSSMDYDSQKDLLAFSGKFANDFLNHCIKHNISGTIDRFAELERIRQHFINRKNFNIINVTLQ